MSEIDMDIRYLKGVGEARAKALKKLGIVNISDLLTYFPRSYEDRTNIYSINSAPLEENVCIKAMIASNPTIARVKNGLTLLKMRAVDESGSIDITYFNQNWLKNTFETGYEYIFFGKISGAFNHRSMTNPDWEKDSEAGSNTECILPKYSLTSGISNKMMRNYIRSSLDTYLSQMPEIINEDLLLKYHLAHRRYSFEKIHFPESFGELELARRRLIFEELYVLACTLGLFRKTKQKRNGVIISDFQLTEFLNTLPFQPTKSQINAIHDSLTDMYSGKAMNRLIQGDVGCGKTLVAAACILAVCKSNCQAALMAPTEILVDQHYNSLKSYLEPFGIRVAKLSGSLTPKEKKQIKFDLNNGYIDLIIGTHALLSSDVSFKKLALVVTDEQHRFGVEQRSTLSTKSDSPHVLVMSATPIPRTLALIIYGDLDVSVINELPPGRQKVDTYAVDSSYRQRLNGFIRKLINEGRQVYIVCPMVEENDEIANDLKSASEFSKELTETFPEFSIGLIHGKMKSKDKDLIMQSFHRGSIDILVSTTVIEVGVDIPNAALIVIENAERFGLSQLHQLRGRVGRGNNKSWCILVSDSKNDLSKERLKILCSTNDGFKISEEDLRLRGPGDFLGKRQHGLPDLHLADLYSDMSVLNEAQEAANITLEEDPELCLEKNRNLLNSVQNLINANINSIN